MNKEKKEIIFEFRIRDRVNNYVISFNLGKTQTNKNMMIKTHKKIQELEPIIEKKAKEIFKFYINEL